MKWKIAFVWIAFLIVVISNLSSCIPVREGERIKVYTQKGLDTLKLQNEQMKNEVSKLTESLDSVTGLVAVKSELLRKDSTLFLGLSSLIDSLELKLNDRDSLSHENSLRLARFNFEIDSLNQKLKKNKLRIAALGAELQELKDQEIQVKEEIKNSLEDSGVRSELFRSVKFDYCVVDHNVYQVQIHHLNKDGSPHGSLGSVQKMIKESYETEILCIMNGGMYQQDRNPQGLLVINGKELFSVDKKQCSVKGPNFYLGASDFPNGAFIILQDGSYHIIKSTEYENWTNKKDIEFATQSGPMLMFDGEINPTFTEGSKNTRIRNGVGIMGDGKLIAAISSEPVNLYDFAQFFKAHGCETSLYLDGTVSRAYIPKLKKEDLKGDFGPIISIIKK